jgi:meso-butanediol dehydrogenase / (S,S)-butanediol dehydrogenase / diacetyl reductase
MRGSRERKLERDDLHTRPSQPGWRLPCLAAGPRFTGYINVEEEIVTLRLEGKVALITGAGSGMGRAAAVAFAREGCRVVAADKDGEAIKTLGDQVGSQVYPVQCDVADEGSVQTAIAAATQAFGPISVVYNNAGISLAAGAGDCVTHELGLEAFDLTLAVNLRGTYLVTKHALPSMLELGQGSIINAASVAGPFLGSSQHAYASAKGGVVGFTRALALSYAPNNIRANTICPGLIRTPMAEFIFRGETASARYLDATPMGRPGEPEEVANLALFLASNESSFITGAVITIDGGVTVN